jgi:hypothetical protein
MDNQIALFNALEINSTIITEMRQSDGYINATKLCQAAKKNFGHYMENKNTKQFIKELESVVGIPTTELIHKIQGGSPDKQGSWVHYKLAIHCAQWCCPKFAVAVSDLVFRYATGQVTTEESQNASDYFKRQLIIKDEQIKQIELQKELEIKQLIEHKDKEIEKLKDKSEKHFFYVYGRRNDDNSISNMTKIGITKCATDRIKTHRGSDPLFTHDFEYKFQNDETCKELEKLLKFHILLPFRERNSPNYEWYNINYRHVITIVKYLISFMEYDSSEDFIKTLTDLEKNDESNNSKISELIDKYSQENANLLDKNTKLLEENAKLKDDSTRITRQLNTLLRTNGTQNDSDAVSDNEIIQQCISTIFEKSCVNKIVTRQVYDLIYEHLKDHFPELKDKLQIDTPEPEEENTRSSRVSMGYSVFFNRIVRDNLKKLDFKMFNSKKKGVKSGVFCKKKQV